MKYLLAITLMCLSQFSFAGSVYKCESGNGTVYQAAPCAANTKTKVFKNLDKASSSNPNQTVCDTAGGAAEAIMSARQRGTDMGTLMNNVLATQTIPEMKDLAKAMITAAYSKPRFSSVDYQQDAIRDFKNENYLACVKGFSK